MMANMRQYQVPLQRYMAMMDLQVNYCNTEFVDFETIWTAFV